MNHRTIDPIKRWHKNSWSISEELMLAGMDRRAVRIQEWLCDRTARSASTPYLEQLRFNLSPYTGVGGDSLLFALNHLSARAGVVSTATTN